jgi:hypothetical protein
VSWSGGLEAERDAPEQRRFWAGCGESDAHACRGLGDAPCDLEQAYPQCREFGARQRVRLGDGVAHGQHEPVSRGMQHEAHLIGECGAATGAIGSKLALVQLDQVLGLPACTVERVVEPLGASALQVGDHVADVQPLRAGLDPGRHAPLTTPGFGAIAGLV